MRSLIPRLLLPLAVVAGGLAAVPWLQAYGANVAPVPVFGAALLAPLVPAVAARAGARRLWLSLLIDVVAFVAYTLAVALHSADVTALGRGLTSGPSQILTFALPLVSPRSLLVAPVALVWLAGALAGECFTRRWFTVLPYPGFLVSYGLAYAATARAHGTSLRGQVLDAGLLLLALLLLRVAQTWVRQDETAESTQADGILPLRGVAIGAATAAAVTLVASLVVQAGAFAGQPRAPQRIPPVDRTQPLSPVDFVASLRPKKLSDPGTPVFSVTLNRAVPGYFGLADLDEYDGSGWTFDRTFRPSGGVVPADTDPNLRTAGIGVVQQYRIDAGPLAHAPWLPYLNRPQRVTGLTVNIDADSGMVVPAGVPGSGREYAVTSRTSLTSFATLPTAAVPDTGTSAQDTTLPVTTGERLSDLIDALSAELHVPTSPAIPFLQAVANELRSHYALSGGPPTPTPTASTPATPRTTPRSAPASTPRSSLRPARTSPSVHRLAGLPALAPKPTPTQKRPSPARRTTTPPASSAMPAPAPTSSPDARAGSTAYSAVLGSIGQDRVGSPEQYATLMALVARELGVPARLATGFRLRGGSGDMVQQGTYRVTTADAWTWVEVPVVGRGWVVLDAAPSTQTAARSRASAAASPSPSPSPTPTQNAQLTKSNGGNAVAPKSSVPHGRHAAPRTLIVVVLWVIVAILALLLLALLVRKKLRRRRRRQLTDPRRRAVAAWHESIDVLSEAGLPALTAMTGDEIAELAGDQFGPEPATHAGFIGRTAGAAVYSTAVLVRPEDADAAWAAERELRRQVNRRLGLGGRLRAWLRYSRDTRRLGSHRRG